MFPDLIWHSPPGTQRIRQSLRGRIHPADLIVFTKNKKGVRQRRHHRPDDLIQFNELSIGFPIKISEFFRHGVELLG